MKKIKKLLSCFLGTAIALTSTAFSISAEKVLVGYLGDINHDMTLTSEDAEILQAYLVGKAILEDEVEILRADLNSDGVVDVYDAILLRRCIAGECEWKGIYEEYDTPDYNFIKAPIAEIDSSLPSQGDASLVIFYIDFPDCTYKNKLSTEKIQEIAFGDADEASKNYPFESMHAFYERSSKGAMNLKGQVFSYTAEKSISYYNENKVAIAKECYEAFKDSVDFSKFDSDGDGEIDATVFTVPESANEDYWWPCSGGFGDSKYVVDGVKVGHIITGNAEPTSVQNFNSTYLHEMGHCMGLPDYYLYYSNDFEGMHGSAGTELMDTDAFSDFCSFSKLMLGWYRENQVSVYDKANGTQSFTLSSAQTDDGNCVIVPYGDFDGNYFSEYFIIEYSTAQGNNFGVKSMWWQTIESGIRIHHVNAELYKGWFNHFKYQNGSEFTNGDDNGIRLIRLVNDGGGTFKTDDVVNNNTSGFGWYDANENESIDPSVTITIGDVVDGKYTVTISPKE